MKKPQKTGSSPNLFQQKWFLSLPSVCFGVGGFFGFFICLVWFFSSKFFSSRFIIPYFADIMLYITLILTSGLRRCLIACLTRPC